MKTTIPLITALLVAPLGRLSASDLLLVEKLDGPITAAEVQAFKNYMRDAQVPTNNLRNAMVYGRGGAAVEALGRMVEITGDPELLDRMLAFTDQMLAARNHPQTGVIVWTGERELVWPNSVSTNGKPVYSATENGDVVGHIAYAAKLILQDDKLRDAKTAGGDPFGFGATYRERAIRYVREMDRTCDSFLLKWLVEPGTQRYYFPDSPLFTFAPAQGALRKPVPWNQQMMLNNGFQRLAECHRLLGDDPRRAQRYDTIVKASVDWFFSQVQRVTVNGHVCYRWAYVAEKPLRHIEDAGHGGADVAGLYRAYRSGRYGITAAMMKPFANTVLYVMWQPDGKFVPRVNGIRSERDHPPGGLSSPWLDLCEFAPELFPMLREANRARIKTSPDLAAGLLWHRQRRTAPAENQPAP